MFQSAHLAIIDSLMALYVKEVATPDAVVAALARLSHLHSGLTPDSADPPNVSTPQQALLTWLNCCRNALAQLIPEASNVQDLCDGVALAALVSLYCPSELPWEAVALPASSTSSSSVAQAVHNLSLVQNFCQSALPADLLHLSPEDVTFLRSSMSQNMLAFLADMFNVLEIHPAKCVCFPGQPGSLSLKDLTKSPSSMSQPAAGSASMVQMTSSSLRRTMSLHHTQAPDQQDERDQFVVHRTKGVPTLLNSSRDETDDALVPARLRQAKEKFNQDSKAEERGEIPAAGKPSNWEVQRRSSTPQFVGSADRGGSAGGGGSSGVSSAGRRSRRNSLSAEESQLTVENFGGSQENLHFIGRNPDKEPAVHVGRRSEIREKEDREKPSPNHDFNRLTSLDTNNSSALQDALTNSPSKSYNGDSDCENVRPPTSFAELSKQQQQQQQQQQNSQSEPPKSSLMTQHRPGDKKTATFAALPNTTTWRQQQQQQPQPLHEAIPTQEEGQLMAAQLHNIRLKLEEKRRHIESDKRRTEIALSRQRQKVGKAAFLQAVTKEINDDVVAVENRWLSQELVQLPVAPDDPRTPDLDNEDIETYHQSLAQQQQQQQPQPLHEAIPTQEEGQLMAAQLHNIRLKLEEKRRHIESDKRRTEIALSRQRQKVGKAAFLQAVTKEINDDVVAVENRWLSQELVQLPVAPDDPRTPDLDNEDIETYHQSLAQLQSMCSTPSSPSPAHSASSSAGPKLRSKGPGSQRPRPKTIHVDRSDGANNGDATFRRQGSATNLAEPLASPSYSGSIRRAGGSYRGSQDNLTTPRRSSLYARESPDDGRGVSPSRSNQQLGRRGSYRTSRDHQEVAVAAPKSAESGHQQKIQFPDEPQRMNSSLQDLQADIQRLASRQQHIHQVMEQGAPPPHQQGPGEFYLHSGAPHQQPQYIPPQQPQMQQQPPPPNYQNYPYVNAANTFSPPQNVAPNYTPTPPPRRTWANPNPQPVNVQNNMENSYVPNSWIDPGRHNIPKYSQPQHFASPPQHQMQQAPMHLHPQQQQQQQTPPQQQQGGGFMLHPAAPSAPSSHNSPYSLHNGTSNASPQHRQTLSRLSQIMGQSPQAHPPQVEEPIVHSSPAPVHHAPIPAPPEDSMAPQSISFIEMTPNSMNASGDSSELSEELSINLQRLNITSGSRTYRLPSPTRPPPKARPAYQMRGDQEDEVAEEAEDLAPTQTLKDGVAADKGFYISFEEAPKRPKPPLRTRKLAQRKALAHCLQDSCRSAGRLMTPPATFPVQPLP
ncbi:hypothetical protein B566_EDAN013266 [Ephemera danica]|nr:hypothetical protein B566_EDAN013266 [Ephemera danica]